MDLYHKDGRKVCVGDQITDFRGDKAMVVGWPKNGGPKHLGLRNRIWVHDGEGELELYPSVFDLEWRD